MKNTDVLESFVPRAYAILFAELRVTTECSCIANYLILCMSFNSFIK